MQIFQEVSQAVSARVAAGGSRPKLATVLVGDDPASVQDVELKTRNARRVAIDSDDHRLPAKTTTGELLNLIRSLNADETVSAILVQQPAPGQIDMEEIVVALAPVKDGGRF